MHNKGFTLIETLIYIAIIGMVVSSFVTFGLRISDSRNKTYSTQEVQANGRIALEIIAQKIRAASGVNIGSSVFGADPGTLSLAMLDVAKNPTIINLNGDDGALQIKEGLSNAVPITSSEVKITNLKFTDLTDGDRENIKIEMTVSFQELNNVNFAYSQNLETAVSVRR